MRTEPPAGGGPLWVEASPLQPCVVCGADRGCLRSEDGQFAVCLNIGSLWPITPGGWLHQLPLAPAPAEPRRPVLVPLDGAARSTSALPFAEAIARGAGAKLVLAAVLETDAPPDRGAVADAVRPVADEAGRALDGLARSVRARGGAVDTRVYRGAVAPTLVAAVRDLRPGLTVMSTGCRSGPGRWLSRGVADRVLRATEAPVLLVPAKARRARPADGPRRVLVALDGSDYAVRALRLASAFAGALDADLTLLRVIETPDGSFGGDPRRELDAARAYLEDLAARIEPLPHAGTHRVVEVATEVGEPAAAIVRVARETGARAIAMAAHLHQDLGHLVRGGVSTRTLRLADVPVLLVPPAAPGRKSQSDPPTTGARRA
ncbi:MAG TPA: universal stress protein [Chloroflexota bacterium]|nr:universal stress protein [Chloroflexota bacterium]